MMCAPRTASARATKDAPTKYRCGDARPPFRRARRKRNGRSYPPDGRSGHLAGAGCSHSGKVGGFVEPAHDPASLPDHERADGTILRAVERERSGRGRHVQQVTDDAPVYERRDEFVRVCGGDARDRALC